MKGIFFAGNFLSKRIGGTSAIYEELAERFAKMEWNVVTASSYPNKIHRMLDFLWTAWKFRKKYQVVSVAVFSDLAFRWSEILCFTLRLIHKPYILSLHGGKLYEFSQKNQIRVKKLFQSAEVVTTPSKYLRQNFLQIRNDLQYVPNGIELSNYPKRIISCATPRLIWLRSFHQIYRPDVAIEVLAKVKIDFPEASLTMIGPDKHDGTFQKVRLTIEKHKLEEDVHIIGAVLKVQVPDNLSKGDIFLNTTIYESFGVSVLEAAACGMCIVTTNVGELPYLWEDGVEVLLVPPNDPQAMATAVKRILTEPGLAQKLSENARRKAEQFDWSIIIPKWEELFYQVIGMSDH